MKVLYVDDEQKAIDQFIQDHAKHGISIEAYQDTHSLREQLEKLSPKDLPDLIVTDLYRTKGPLGTQAADAINHQVNVLLAKIAETRKELEELVALQEEPAAIDALESLRATPKLENIPVIICTREGLNLLNDELLRKSLRLGANWMIKGRSPEVIRELMQREYQEAILARKRPKRDVVLMLIGSIIGAMLGYVLFLVST
jgi:CheY-like chemotaxis protein